MFPPILHARQGAFVRFITPCDRASLLVTESMDEEEWRDRVKALARVGI
jgi:hypothetical protein